MAFVMMTSKFPLSASEDVGKVYIDKVLSKPAPDYIMRREVWVVAGAEDGLKSYELYEFEDDHLNDGLKWASESIVQFRVIPGYTYTMEILMGAVDALAILGLKQ